MIKLKQGNCLEVMKEIPSGSVDAVISDIPYGISYSSWDITHENTNSALLGSSPAQAKSKLFKTRGKPLNGWSSADKQNGRNFEDWCSEWLKETLPEFYEEGRRVIRTTVKNLDLNALIEKYS